MIKAAKHKVAPPGWVRREMELLLCSFVSNNATTHTSLEQSLKESKDCAVVVWTLYSKGSKKQFKEEAALSIFSPTFPWESLQDWS